MQVQLSKLSLILKSLTRLEENIFELFLLRFKHEKLHLLAQNSKYENTVLSFSLFSS